MVPWSCLFHVNIWLFYVNIWQVEREDDKGKSLLGSLPVALIEKHSQLYRVSVFTGLRRVALAAEMHRTCDAV